jgi:hypothetical protein
MRAAGETLRTCTILFQESDHNKSISQKLSRKRILSQPMKNVGLCVRTIVKWTNICSTSASLVSKFLDGGLWAFCQPYLSLFCFMMMTNNFISTIQYSWHAFKTMESTTFFKLFHSCHQIALFFNDFGY